MIYILILIPIAVVMAFLGYRITVAMDKPMGRRISGQQIRRSSIGISAVVTTLNLIVLSIAAYIIVISTPFECTDVGEVFGWWFTVGFFVLFLALATGLWAGWTYSKTMHRLLGWE